MKAFINVKRIFVFLYVMAITTMLVLPSVKYSFTYMQIFLFSLPFIILALVEGKIYRKIFAINMSLLFISALCSFVINYRGNISGVFNIVVSMYFYVLPLLICQYVIDLNDKVLMKWITIAVCSMFAYMLIVTFNAIADDPDIARKLAYGIDSDPYINEQRMKNVGGFGFCYCLCMLPPYLTSVISRVKKKQRIWLIITLIMLLVFSVYSQYTTFVILSVGAIFYVILTQGKMSIRKVIAAVLLLFIVLTFRKILWFLANNLGLTTLSSHFYDLYYMLEGEGDLGRWQMYKANIVLFLNNPIFGVDLTDGYNSYLVGEAHSMIFGRMSGGGLVGIGCYAGFIATAWYYLVRVKKMKYLIPVFVTYIVLAFLNPVQPEISVAAFMLVPLIEYQILNREDQYYV